MNEFDSFVGRICQEFGYDLNNYEMIGRGYTSSIWKLSDELCVKITEKATCPDFLMSIEQSENLCIPMKVFVSPSGKYYGYVQRYISSFCLQDFIISGQTLTEKEVAYIIGGILKGLDLLHRYNYVHRDFYPGNIMIYSREPIYIPVIIDFDETEEVNDNTQACFRFSGYHAPEVVINNNSYDEKAEVFAVGIIMWELLFGKCPFGGYDFFGAIIANSWEEYEKNSNEYHQKVKDALMTLDSCLSQTEKLSEKCSDLLRKLLDQDRKSRITASEAMKHAFFGDIIMH